MRNTYFFFIILILPLYVKSQGKIKLNKFDRSYFAMTHCPYDSSAGAFYIENHGKSRLDHNFEIEFTHHVIVKILNPEEYDRGDIKIRYSRNDRITSFSAASYNMVDGQVVESELKRKDAIIEDVNDEVRSFNFTFPNVKEGTIIEYTYKVNYGSIVRLNTWYFQTSIPVLRSQYEVSIPTFFTYERMYQGYFPLKTGDIRYENLPLGTTSTNHQIHNYVGENIPAFKNEPYITTRGDFIGKIDFELKKYSIPGQGEKVYIPDNFLEIARQNYKSDYWHGSVTSSKFTSDIVDGLKSANPDQLKLAEAIYNYVRDNFSEDYDVDFPTQKKVFQEKKGTATQINKVLAAMFNQAGFETNLVRLSTRKHGRIWKRIAMARQFNHTIVSIVTGDQRILLDATEKNIPFNVLPDYCLNGEGLLISANPQWIPLNPNKKNSITYSGEFELEDDILIGEFKRTRSGYFAWDFLDDTDDYEEFKNSFNENMETWIIDSHEISELQNEETIEENVETEIEGKVDDVGDLVYLNPILYNQLESNPFKSPERSFPINYTHPQTNTHYYKINIGEEYEVVELPKPLSIGLPEKGGKLIFNVSQNGNQLTVMCRTQINKAEFAAAQYPYLREFYAQVIEKQGEQIVLRRK